jgi:cell division protein FtsL
MKLAYLALAATLIASPALAQQAQQPTPSQTALQIDNVINGWAQQIEGQTTVIQQLQAQVKDLTAKCADRCTAPEPAK